MEVLYCGFSWGDNIGNAFIDYSVKYILSSSIKEGHAKIYNISNVQPYNYYNYVHKLPYSVFNRKYGLKKGAFDLRVLTDPDLIVLGGSLFDVYWCKVHDHFLRWLIKKQIPVLVLGGGGGNEYRKKDFEFVADYWKKINLLGFVSRDEFAYESFKSYAKNSYSGIDNAFYLNDFFMPIRLAIKPYYIKTFDLTYDRQIEDLCDKKVISLSHRLLMYDSLKELLLNRIKQMKIIQSYDMTTDCPDDYLHLYGNAEATYSDRVHACVATLSFGGMAKYYDNSDRSYLFDRVDLKDIRKKLVRINKMKIKKEKIEQLKYLREFFWENFKK
ncbi:polysaccharide pyruvyl transferase family protein [Prosthecochloris sp. SCSIO W1103]|uniref:polysaccharide pyruvyl transferase family protein n=1 Tax=Prosthecochloris sp. SCSIO W1103 TaxID=2992244 RepID=UPI00223D11DF|nr:polysaccharide pyruvyl transferase family protein [Prosthecochloris sp. SCSIO W1103]UZJ38144.1 polysaccharide pyruvyl transferase family protein [Prosthecochloris sp. SCSIO W1103]